MKIHEESFFFSMKLNGNSVKMRGKRPMNSHEGPFSCPSQVLEAVPRGEKECGGYEAPVAPERSMVDTLGMLDEALKRLAAAQYSA